jgi:hypothetical protein
MHQGWDEYLLVHRFWNKLFFVHLSRSAIKARTAIYRNNCPPPPHPKKKEKESVTIGKSNKRSAQHTPLESITFHSYQKSQYQNYFSYKDK